MSVPLVLRPQAHHAIDAIHLYLYGENQSAAARFLEALDQTFDRLAAHPESGRNVRSTELPGLQLSPVKAFRAYLILFRFGDGQVEILDIFHGSRDMKLQRE